jgi:hypothetical protein
MVGPAWSRPHNHYGSYSPTTCAANARLDSPPSAPSVRGRGVEAERCESFEGIEEVVFADKDDCISTQPHATRLGDQALDFDQVRCEPIVSRNAWASFRAIECGQHSRRNLIPSFPRLSHLCCHVTPTRSTSLMASPAPRERSE